MRPIYLARFGSKVRPVLVLTFGGRTLALPDGKVTVAGITSTIHGLATEVPVGSANGLDHDCVVNLADIQTIPRADLRPASAWLLPHQESALHQAIIAAFDLDLA